MVLPMQRFIIQVFSQRTYLWALQFRSFHLHFFSFESMYIWLFNKYILILGIDPPFLLVPVLLQSVPVEAELDRDVSAVFRTVRIVRLLLVPVLRNLF